MKLAIFALFISGFAVAQESALDIPKNMKQYFFGMLVEGPKSKEPRAKEQQAALLKSHLAYIRSQIESGKYLLAGPFLDGGRIAGVIVVQAASADEAKKIVEADPMAQAGQVAVEIHPAMLPDLSSVKVDYAPKQ